MIDSIPPYTPPAPFGTQASDGCWYFAPPDIGQRGSASFTVPNDAVTGQATMKILVGQLQENRAITREVRDALRAQLGRYPSDEEVRAAVAARPDRYSERTSEVTLEQLFVQGAVDTQLPAQVVSSGGSIERGVVRSAACPSDYQIVRAQICEGSNVYTENQCAPVTVTTPRAGTVRYSVPSTYPNGYVGHIVGYNQVGQACFRERVTIGTPPTPIPRR